MPLLPLFSIRLSVIRALLLRVILIVLELLLGILTLFMSACPLFRIKIPIDPPVMVNPIILILTLPLIEMTGLVGCAVVALIVGPPSLQGDPISAFGRIH